MIHALLLTPAYPPFLGGGERYVRSLAQQLAQRGITVTILTSLARNEQALWAGTSSQTDSWEPEKDSLVTVYRLPIRSFPGGRIGLLSWRKCMVLLSTLPGDQSFLLQRMARLFPPIQRLDAALHTLPHDVNIVHGFNISWEYSLLAGWQYAQQHNLPFVATPFMHFGTGHDRVARNSTMDHQRRLLIAANSVLPLTANEKDGLEQLGVPAKNITAVGGGIDPLPPLGDTAVLQQKHQLTTPYAIFIGRASQEKGAIHAAQATLALAQQGFDLTLALIGQPAPEFTHFYNRLSPAEQRRIRPLGILSDTDKHSLLAAATALLLPSRTDSFGIVLLEAWAHGVPVIAARAGGIPGVVDDGENGLLIPFGDVPAISAALRRLLDDPELRRSLGENGREKVMAVYSWKHVAERVHRQYSQLLNLANL
ncbi:MAG: glycosyltransferase family 4 protein [Anaerolineales bacterium]|nr:glycosyltransferase family 4 protein [Anaerolineales bacterium]MCB8991742.1 glycosyltransferase family 4 protein [Ardenticatenaceae bacterium]